MSEERREYFRIDDEIALDYRPISEGEGELLREKIQSRVVDKFTAASSFTSTSRQMTHDAQGPNSVSGTRPLPAGD